MKTRYTIYKNKVWLDLLYEDTPMNSKCLFVGKNKKECEQWLKERKGKKNENN